MSPTFVAAQRGSTWTRHAILVGRYALRLHMAPLALQPGRPDSPTVTRPSDGATYSPRTSDLNRVGERLGVPLGDKPALLGLTVVRCAIPDAVKRCAGSGLIFTISSPSASTFSSSACSIRDTRPRFWALASGPARRSRSSENARPHKRSDTCARRSSVMSSRLARRCSSNPERARTRLDIAVPLAF